jgi:hypothetical protein
MSDHTYYNLYPAAYQPAPPVVSGGSPDTACASLIRLATLGAVVGGTAAAAANLRRLRAGDLQAGAVIAATARSAAVGAAATAVAGAVAGTVAEQGALRLALMFAVGTGVAYGLDGWLRHGREADHA